MSEKTVYCGYCGVELSTIVFITRENMHIQKAEILTVCDKCGKPTTVIYGQSEFKKEKREIGHPVQITPETFGFTTCTGCGSSINPERGCAACRAMGQKA